MSCVPFSLLPRIDRLILFAHNILTVDDAMLSSVAKIKTLKTVRLSFVVLVFDGELDQLLALPHLAELSLGVADVSEDDLQTEAERDNYNRVRPHGALGNRTPSEFARPVDRHAHLPALHG
jgi:transposase InsO family protein